MRDHLPEEQSGAQVRDLAQRVSALEAAVVEHARLLGTEGPCATSPPTDPLRVVWSSAPLLARLAFVRAALPADHPRQIALGEAATLLELCGSAVELQAWISSYPAVFAEASARLVALDSPQPEAPVDLLACEVLRSAREAAASTLQQIGVDWIAPLPGEELGAACEVVGEAPSPEVPRGRVQALRRPGFRRDGKLELRAQVICSAGPGTTAATDAPASPIATPPPILGMPLPADTPDGTAWLSELHQAAGGNPAAIGLTAGLRAVALSASPVSDPDLCRAMEPLLPLFGGGWSTTLAGIPAGWVETFARVRPQVEAWLRDRQDADVLAPVSGDHFDTLLMECVGERRTAHAHERGTVARVQRAGLCREGRTLVRAQVIRYETGGPAYGG